MDADFWHDKWRNNQIGFHLEQPHPLLRACWPGLGLSPGSRVLVPLCGKSPDLLWLAEAGCEVLGIELSPIAVRAFFTENGLCPERSGNRFRSGTIELRVSDIFGLEPGSVDRIDVVYDRAALIALPPDTRQRYVAQLRDLAPDAPHLLIALEYPDGAIEPPPYSIGARDIETLYGTCATHLAKRTDHVKTVTANEHAWHLAW